MKLVNMNKNSYEGISCRVIHDGQLTKNFEIRTGVRQGCLLSPFLFILAIDWIMKTETNGKRNGIQWKILTQLDDLDFADDLALMSHSHRQMQDNTTDLFDFGIYHDFDEGISNTFGIYIIHKLVCITCRYQFG